MKFITLSIALASITLTSCTNGPSARTGTVVGALGGAAVGGIIGNQSGRGLEGAAIGAAAGAVGGNAIGGAQDQRREEEYRRSRAYDNRYDQHRY